ncbi:MAG: type II toxin-antitoxin system RelE/ParE family toxin [Micrococcales bacterium]|nr:type II toxin-antitoxin system RelE/ParE family toxin [Micrococcales bacterium]
MTLHWREHPAAREELFSALDWYDDQEPGLGDRLADEIAAGVAFVRQWPDAPPLYRGRRLPRVRRKSIDVFPYGIIYFVRDDEVIVVAYAHARRRPGYWRKRLEDL